MQPDDVAIRKRTQIAKANRAMFLWIAIASALVGAALVVSIFLAQKLIYNEKVLAAKQQTVSTLARNNAVVTDLEKAIRALDANEALASVKTNENNQALQSILDALPSDANSLALGASLQNKLLTGVGGVTLESLQVTPVSGIESLNGGDVVGSDDNSIAFQFIISGSDAQLKKILQNLERSIRTIHIDSLKIEIQSKGPVMTVQARAFYEPTKTIELQEKAVQ